jgi:hypothetical protein
MRLLNVLFFIFFFYCFAQHPVAFATRKDLEQVKSQPYPLCPASIFL